ncbi:hypothetical protein D6779_07500 [Candidatus Parcubacteria bacterium]|nr:MAG: hypothetical protein D6779_07500 [Candidatus Parcubacteria bacterium]
MAVLHVLEEYPEFALASREAKELAVHFKTSTGIKRSSKGWAVLVPKNVLDELSFLALLEREDSGVEYDDYGDEESQREYEEYQREIRNEVIQPLIEELQEYEDSWARSEEDGWFYED